MVKVEPITNVTQYGTITHRKQLQPIPRKSHESSANCLSRWFICWLWPLMRKGNNISAGDVQTASAEPAAGGPSVLRAKWNSVKAKRELKYRGSNVQSVKIVPLLWHLFKWPVAMAGLARLFSDLLLAAAPVLLGELIVSIESRNDHKADRDRVAIILFGLLRRPIVVSPLVYGCALSAALFAALFFRSILQNRHSLWMAQVAVRVQSALSTALFGKILKLPMASSNAMESASWSSGNFINTMSTDIDRVADFTTQLHTLWSMPLQVIITVALLYYYIGLASLGALLVFIFLFPLNALVLRWNVGWQRAQQQFKTKRLQFLKEVISGIVSVKLYSWEMPLNGRIDGVRVDEVGMIRRSNLLRISTETYQTMALHLGLLCTFLLFRMLDPVQNLLTPKVTFVAYTLVGLVRPPLFQFAQVMQKFAQVRESKRRLEILLKAKEVSAGKNNGTTAKIDIVQNSVQEEKNTENALEFRHCAKQSQQQMEQKEKPKNVANNPNNDVSGIFLDVDDFVIKRGQLVAIVGQHGSGKSAFLAALMGELELLNAQLSTHSTKMAICPQHPFIIEGTVRENILLENSNKVDENLLLAVMQCCQLHGDQGIQLDTQVAARGLNLSGGQKARLALARALYHRAQLYLLDDPLSACDPKVRRAIFEQALGPQSLLSGTTRILVLQERKFIAKCDLVIQMEDNKIHWCGSPSEYLARYPISEEHEDTQKEVAESNVVEEEVKNEKSEFSVINEKTKMVAAAPQIGAVSWRIYLRYLNAMGCVWAFAFIALLVLNNAVALGNTYWLGEWVADVGQRPAKFSGHVEWFQFGVFGLLVFAGLFTIALACFCQLMGAAVASLKLHRRCLNQLFVEPIAYFSTTENGKILNRFGDDFAQIDVELSHSLRMFITGALLLFQILITIAVSTSLLFLAFIAPALLLYLYILRKFMLASTRLARMERTTRNPLYAAIEEALEGRALLRAYGAHQRFEQRHDGKLQEHLGCKYLKLASQRWLSIWLELIGNVAVLCVALLAVLAANGVLTIGEQTVMPSFVGLSRSLGLAMVLAMLVQQYTQIEAGMVSAERVFQSLREEKQGGKNQHNLPEDLCPQQPGTKWPYRGAIEFKNYSTSYHDDGPDSREVLRGITAKLNPSEKIAIIGRTGSGKSSMVLALFRILEAKKGHILVDGIDIARVDKETLRSRITVIPQDPLILSDTIRFNLDPCNHFTDPDLWFALERAGLKEFVRTKNEGLSHKLMGSDSQDMSAGQIQLLLLARAILRGGRVLVMDELGAALDPATGDIVRRIVAEEFRASTMVAITHRAQNLGEHYERIFEMNEGQLKELKKDM